MTVLTHNERNILQNIFEENAIETVTRKPMINIKQQPTISL
jgi:hypothetical protein